VPSTPANGAKVRPGKTSAHKRHHLSLPR
jgi:hypothetical protein